MPSEANGDIRERKHILSKIALFVNNINIQMLILIFLCATNNNVPTGNSMHY
jgi:hypothetical protein